MINVKKNKEAVSPIIGVILLLGITVVLASVMFLWVSSIVLQSSSAPVGDITIEKTGGNETTVNYTVTLNSFRPKTDPKDIICYFYDEDGISRGSFDFPNKDCDIKVNVNGDKNGYANWTDEDENNMVSSYDVIKISIKGMEKENDRTLLSSYSFALRYEPNGALIAEETLQ